MNPPPILPGPKRERNVLVIVLVASAVILVLAPLLAWVAYRVSGRRHVEIAVAAIRRAGEPVTWEELDRWYVEPPPGQNAAGIYTQAFARLVEPKPKPTNLPVIGLAKLPELDAPLPAEMKIAIADCLRTNAAALELMYQAAGLHECRYPVDLSEGFATLLPHCAKLRAAARLLMLEATLSSENGRTTEAQRALIAGLAAGSSLRQEPLLISRLVAIAINGMMASALEQSVNRVAFTDAQLAELMAALADAETGPGISRTMAGERASCSGCFELIRIGKLHVRDFVSDFGFTKPPVGLRALVVVYRVSGLAEREEAYYLQVLGDYMAGVRRPLTERVQAAKTVAIRTDSIPRYYILCRMFLSALDKFVEKDAQGFAQLEVARSALAVQRYRLAQGRLPAALGDLVPAYLDPVPVDPFDGQPLRYKPLATGFVVYSVGRDGKDDGGRARNDEGVAFQPGTDITFTVVR